MTELVNIIVESGAPPWLIAVLAVALWIYRDLRHYRQKREGEAERATMKEAVGQLSKVLRETTYRLSVHRNGKKEVGDTNLPYLSTPPPSQWEDTTEVILRGAERAERDAVRQIAVDSGREPPGDESWPDWYARGRDVDGRYSMTPSPTPAPKRKA